MKYLAFITILIFSVPVKAEKADYLQSVHAMDISMAQEECMSAVDSLFTSMGLSEVEILDIDEVKWASVEDVTYSVVCRADKGIAFMSVSHFDYQTPQVREFHRQLLELLNVQK